MARRHFRVALWHLILAVAIVGLLLGTEAHRRRIFYFQRMAAYHADQELATTPPIRNHGSEVGDLRYQAQNSRRKGQEYRSKQVEAQRALDTKRAADLQTTQQERRAPWYWGMMADE